jgi:multicomponent Na+:H+ antiporter subunit G
MIANIFLVLGGLFYLLGGLGILRMPDTFNRIQAGTKATTLGAFALLLGVGIANPEWLFKVALIIIFIALSNPIGSSALAKATYKSFPLPKNVVQDDLKELHGGEDNDLN